MRSRHLSIAILVLTVAACGGTTAPAVSPSGPERSGQSAAADLPSPPESLRPFPSASVAALPPPALGGTIAFMRQDGPDHWRLWRACADLSEARPLTPKAAHQSGWPVVSPDGTRIAFNSNRDDPDLADDVDVWDIYTMDLLGGDVTKLTFSAGVNGDPGYSPDGELIAYYRTGTRANGIYVMDAADGDNVRFVTGLPDGVVTVYEPRFSPDGAEVVFTGDFGPDTGALFIVGIDGTGLRRITPETLFPAKPAWAPDGTRIVFDVVNPLGVRGDVWIVAPDGSGLRNVTEGPADPAYWDGFSDPIWSPDGSLIMLVHGLHYDDGRLTVGLATIRPDGTGLSYVGDGLGDEHKPDWSDANCRP
jgi:Tol biopolymer transport system component